MVTVTVRASKAVLNVAVLLVITLLITLQIALWRNSAHVQGLDLISRRLEYVQEQLMRLEKHSHSVFSVSIRLELLPGVPTTPDVSTSKRQKIIGVIERMNHPSVGLGTAPSAPHSPVPPNGVNITELDMVNAEGQIYSLRDYPQFHLREVRNATHYTVVFRPLAMRQDPAFYRAGPHGLNITFQFVNSDPFSASGHTVKSNLLIDLEDNAGLLPVAVKSHLIGASTIVHIVTAVAAMSLVGLLFVASHRFWFAETAGTTCELAEASV